MTAQTVVVILATVVDVWTTVDPAGQLGASKQISVTRYMEVTRKTEVVVSLRARPTSAKASVDAEQGYRIAYWGLQEAGLQMQHRQRERRGGATSWRKQSVGDGRGLKSVIGGQR